MGGGGDWESLLTPSLGSKTYRILAPGRTSETSQMETRKKLYTTKHHSYLEDMQVS